MGSRKKEFFLKLQIYNHFYNIVLFTIFINLYKTQIISLWLNSKLSGAKYKLHTQ